MFITLNDRAIISPTAREVEPEQCRAFGCKRRAPSRLRAEKHEAKGAHGMPAMP
jgi:hypothetical protein